MTFKFNIIFLTIALFLSSCSIYGDEKECEPNSEEAKSVIEWIIESRFRAEESVSNFYAYRDATGIDPFYFVKFTLTNDKDFSRIFDGSYSISTSSLNLYLLNKSPNGRASSYKTPNWYSLTIDSSTIHFTKKMLSGSKSGIYDSKTETYFIFYQTS